MPTEIPNFSPLNSIKAIADKSPSKPALYWYTENGRQCLSFEQLWQQVDSYANLFASRNLKRNDVVALLLPRHAKFVIALLALWRLGVAFMPLDPIWRKNDINAIKKRLENAQAKMLVIDKVFNDAYGELSDSLIEKFVLTNQPVQPIANRNDAIIFNSAETDLAFLYCSSGTTDIPKIIEIPFEGINDRINGIITKMEISSDDVVLASCSFGFDASLCEILMALQAGAAVMLASEEVRSDFYNVLPAFLAKCEPKPTVALLLPSQLKQVDDKERYVNQYPKLKKILTTGEKCEHKWLDPWFKAGVRLFNGYGPTETTIGATITEVLEKDNTMGIQDETMGLKIYLAKKGDDGAIVSLLKDQDKDEGIICIAGRGIGQYRGNAEKNKQVFLTGAAAEQFGFASGDKVFVTSDLAERKNGKLIFKNRTDRNIKPAGAMVNLDAIENRIDSIAKDKRCPGLLKAIVLAENNQHIYLFLFVNENFDKDEFFICFKEIEFSMGERPSFCFTIHDNNWQNANGKCIRSLSDITSKELKQLSPHNVNEYANDSEPVIASIWQDILFENISSAIMKHIRLNLHDEFQQLGGNSLTFGQMISRLWKHPLLSFNQQDEDWPTFMGYAKRHPTIYDLANYICIQKELIFKTLIKREHLLHIFCLLTDSKQIDDAQKRFEHTKFQIHYFIIPQCFLEPKQKDNTEKTLLAISHKLNLCMHDMQIGGLYTLVLFDDQLNPYGDHFKKYFESERAEKLSLLTVEKLLDEDIKALEESQITAWLKFKLHEFNKKQVQQTANNDLVLYLNARGQTSIKFISDMLEQNFQSELAWLKARKLRVIINNTDFMNRQTLLAKNDFELIINKLSHNWQLTIGYNDNLIHPDDLLQDKLAGPKERFESLRSFFEGSYQQYQLEEENISSERILDEFEIFLKSLSCIASKYVLNKKEGNISLKEKRSQWELEAENILLTGSGKPTIWALPYFHLIRHLLLESNTEEEIYHLPSALYEDVLQEQYLTWFNEERRYLGARSAQIPNVLDTTEKASCTKISQGRYPTPLFLFSPLTGDIPGYYTELVSYLREQTCYVLSLSPEENGYLDRSVFLNEKVNYYLALIRNIQPKGPYLLGGWSFGGVLAYSVGVALEKAGEKVLEIINIDCPSPFKIRGQDEYTFVKEMISTLAERIEGNKSIKPLLESNNNSEVEKLFKQVLESPAKHGSTSKLAGLIKNAQSNYKAYFEFAQRNDKLQAPYIIYEAQTITKGINDEGQFEKWQAFTVTKPSIKKMPGDHFTIFRPELFCAIRDQIQEVQDVHPALKIKPLSPIEYAKSLNGKQDNSQAYVAPSVSNQSGLYQDTNIVTALDEFLSSSNLIFLLLGKSGYGKSYNCQFLLKYRLNKFLEDTAHWLPLLVNLASLNPTSLKNILNDFNLSLDEVKNNKINLLLILDGLDESKTPIAKTFIQECRQYNCKIVITCQEEHRHGEALKSSNADIMVKYLNLFNDSQLQKFCEQKTINYNRLKDTLRGSPLAEIIKIPLFCSLYMNKNNNIIFQKTDENYDTAYALIEYCTKSIAKNKVVAYQEKGHYRHSGNPLESIIAMSEAYARSLAYAIWSGQPLDYYLSDDEDSKVARELGQIKITNGKPAFAHNLIYYFHLANFFIKTLIAKNNCSIVAIVKLLGSKLLSDDKQMLVFLKEAGIEAMNHGKSLIWSNTQSRNDPQMRTNEHYYIYQLFNLLWNSCRLKDKSSLVAKQAAANAITILNYLGINLSNLNFSYAQLNGALLDNAWLAYSNFNGANLSEASLKNAYLSGTDFSKSNLSNVKELSSIKFFSSDNGIDAYTISSDSTIIATLTMHMKQAIVHIWDLQQTSLIAKEECPSNSCLFPDEIAINIDSQNNLLVIVLDQSIYLYGNSHSNFSLLQTLSRADSNTYHATSAVVSPNGTLISIASVIETDKAEDNTQHMEICIDIWIKKDNSFVHKCTLNKDTKLACDDTRRVYQAFDGENNLIVGDYNKYYIINMTKPDFEKIIISNQGYEDKDIYFSANSNIFLQTKKHLDGIFDIGKLNSSRRIKLQNVGFNNFHSITFDRLGQQVAAATSNAVYIWETQQGNLIQTIPIHSIDTPDVMISPDNKLLMYASLGCSSRLRVKQISNELFEVATHDIMLGNAGKYALIRNSKDNSHYLFNLVTNRIVHCYTESTRVILHPDRPLIARIAGRSNCSVFITSGIGENGGVPLIEKNLSELNLPDNIFPDLIMAQDNTLLFVLASRKHNKIASVYYIFGMICWNDNTAKYKKLNLLLEKTEFHQESFITFPSQKTRLDVFPPQEPFRLIKRRYCLNITPGIHNAKLRLYSLSNKKLIQETNLSKNYHNHVFSLDGTFLAVQSDDSLKIYRLNDGEKPIYEEIYTVDAKNTIVVFSPDNNYILLYTSIGGLLDKVNLITSEVMNYYLFERLKKFDPRLIAPENFIKNPNDAATNIFLWKTDEIICSKDNKYIALTSSQGFIDILEFNTLALLQTINISFMAERIKYMLCFADNNDIAISTNHGSIYYWRHTPRGSCQWSLHLTNAPSKELLAFDANITGATITESNANVLKNYGALSDLPICTTEKITNEISLNSNNYPDDSLINNLLPDALLKHIFLYVSYAERIDLAVVCKKWYCILNLEDFYRLTQKELTEIKSDILRLCQQVMRFSFDATLISTKLDDSSEGNLEFTLENEDTVYKYSYSAFHLKTVGFFNHKNSIQPLQEQIEPIIKTGYQLS
jgi:thioesterase domain-containing protein/acyl-coenzyme A synthetase/AMP-(fatty) acid ligase